MISNVFDRLAQNAAVFVIGLGYAYSLYEFASIVF